MIFWAVYTVILTVFTTYISGIPLLRASDLGQNGHLVHFHRDTSSGGHTRHIHHRPTVKRSHKTYRDTFFQKLGSAVNPSTVYEVPRNRHFNDAHAGRFAMELRTLIDKPSSETNNTSDLKSDNSDSGDNNNKHENNNDIGIHSVQNRDAPTPPSEAPVHTPAHFPVQTLPHGLQFLNRQSQQRRLQGIGGSILDQSNRLTLDLNTLLGETIGTTTPPSLTPSDVFMSTGSSLDLGFLLGDLGGTEGSVNNRAHNTRGHDHHGQGHGHHVQSHGHHVQGHSHEHGHGGRSHTHNSIHDKTNNARSNRIGNTFMGMFGQQSSRAAHDGHLHQKAITMPTTNSVPSRLFYQNSTQHARAITKRGVVDSDSVSRFPKTFIDNILNIRIMRTTPRPRVIPTTHQTRYGGFLTTPRSIETQIERLSGIHLEHGRKKKRPFVGSNIPATQQTTTLPKVMAPSQNELVHLQGIHVMFSNGKQDSSDKIPTVHLTAAVSENINHLLRVSGGSSQGSYHSSNVKNITDKITGTAVIRDGHLYLVIYPFGNNKSLELHYNQTKQRIPLPRNKPVSFSDSVKPSAEPNVSSPLSQAAKPTISTKIASSTIQGQMSSIRPTEVSHVSSTGHSDFSTSSGMNTTSTTHKHPSLSKPEVSTRTAIGKDSHHHGHDHQHHQHDPSTPSLTGLKLSEVNDTTLQTLLAPIDRFMSPWKSLNFSEVFPYSSGTNMTKNSSKHVVDEDTEVDVVTFIAKANDPFNRMKDIIKSLVNKTLSNVSSTPSPGNTTETKFNFELKLESGKEQRTTNKESTANPNNSEEKTLDTNVKVTTVTPKASATSNTFEQVTKTTTTTITSFGISTQENSFALSGSTGENVTPSQSLFDQATDGSNLKTMRTNVSGGEIKTTVRVPIKEDEPKNVYMSDFLKKDNSKELSNNIGGSGINPQTAGQEANDSLSADSNVDHLLHAAENIAPSTSGGRNKDFNTPYTTLSYIPNYTKSTFQRQRIYQITTPPHNVFQNNLHSVRQNVPAGAVRNTILGSNLQPLIQRTSPNRFRQGLNRGQSEQIISLSDILNDIRRIQLHNMQRFNIQNNNFDTMILSETHQKPVIRRPIVMEGPVIKESATRRYSDFPAAWNNYDNNQLQQRLQHIHKQNRQQLNQQKQQQQQKLQQQQQKFAAITPATPRATQRRFDREAIFDNAFEAMLVLSVDDILSDQTDLHGAIVLSHRRETSSSNKK